MTTVALTVDHRIATITLCRPDSLNALNLTLAAELLATVRELSERDDVDVVVLASQGRAFCAGGDVGEMAESGDASAYLRALTRDVHESLALIRELPVPVVARAHGAVAGGGLGVMLSADVVICADQATFTPAYGALGLSPDCGTTVFVPEAIGARRAREFLALGRRIDASTARKWGMVAEVTTLTELDERVDAAVQRLQLAGREAAAATKRLLRMPSAELRKALAVEAASISGLAATEFARDRIVQFVNR